MGRIRDYNRDFGTVYVYKIKDVSDIKSASSWIANLQNIPLINVKEIELQDWVYGIEEGNHNQNLPTNSTAKEIYQNSKEYIDAIYVLADYKGKKIRLIINFREEFIIRIGVYKHDIDIVDELEKVLKLN